MHKKSIISLRLLCTLCGLLLILTQTTSSYAQSDAKQEVQRVAEAFLDDLSKLDYDALEQHTMPNMVMVIVAKQKDGWRNIFVTRDDWIAGLKRNNKPFREPITNIHITIDSEVLAYMRADFQVIREGKILSHGVDHFTMVKDEGRWKLAAAAFTSIPGE